MRENIKVVFMGTPDFAKASLEKLKESGYDVVGVFTNPDKPSGRGMKVKMSEVKKYSISKDIPVFQPAKLRNNKEVLEILEKLNPDVICVVAYGKILPKEILEYPKYGCINVHGSLLPKYRGAAPMQWAIINGEKKTGITTMFMDEGMDTGDMLLKEEVNIELNDDFETIHDKLKAIGANLLIKTIDTIISGNYSRTKQPDDFSLAPMISREMTKIDFNKTSREIYNFVRGLSPYPGVYMIDDENKKYKVYKVEEINKEYETDEMKKHNTACGVVCKATKSELIISTKDGYIKILEILPPNSKKMNIVAFLNGNKINVGKKFI